MALTRREAMFGEFAEHYDRIYSYKDTAKEVRFIMAVIRKHNVRGGAVLDVACGTGRHAALLVRGGFEVLGIDKNEGMLRIARKNVPKARFLRGDMRSFRLPRRFDVIMCMFTSMNYNTKKADLTRTLRNFERHLAEGGLIVFDTPLLRRGSIERTSGAVIDENTAVLYSWRERGLLTIGDIYWIVGKPGWAAGGKGARIVHDRHVLRMYQLSEIRDALRSSGLESEVFWDFSASRRSGRRPVFICWRRPPSRPR